MEFRLLKADEIDVRVAQVKESGCSLLLYKDARVDMNILDTTPGIGPGNWQRRHYECKGNLFCSVGIKIDGEWVWKDDAGAESQAEKEKGEASDSFKRACVNWGIGRELYTAPFIWIPSSEISIVSKNGKATTYDKFEVTKIAYTDDRKISGLAIWRLANKDKDRKRVFVWQGGTKRPLYLTPQSVSLENADRLMPRPKAIIEWRCQRQFWKSVQTALQ